MPTTLVLPTRGGVSMPWSPSGRPPVATRETSPTPSTPSTSRTAYAAVHVVADPLAETDPPDRPALDWESTLAFRRHIWSCGLGVAEAMDTAQRGMGLDWATARELIGRTGTEAAAVGGAWCAGVGTDQMPGPGSLDEVVDAWREQLEVVAAAGAVPVVMASRQLAAVASGPDDYHRAYGKVLAETPGPVLLHWLGEPFDPALAGYWGHRDVRAAGQELAALCRDHARLVAGVKVSVLDADVEVGFRRSLPPGVPCLTGDDFSFPQLIEGDEHGHSDALLGIFDPIAAVASAALGRLDAGDASGFRSLLDATLPLSRELFRPPTPRYKVGVTFLAYLAGHQRHFRMVGGLEATRSIVHLADVLRLADAAGVLPDPELAAARMRPLLAAAGIDQ
ncbi:MAG: dihydrodipicolinate synthase family protein [Acidimicrobiales bacterium]